MCYCMDASTIISAYRDPSQSNALTEIRQSFIFNPKKTVNETIKDENLELRTEITEALLHDFSLADIKLIRELFKAELDCEHTIWRHDNLYQLSFYLYSLGQLEDTFLLYEAKYGLKHMDASTMQDRYSITVGHEVNEVQKYVYSRFEKDPNLKDNYSGLLDELQGIIDEPDYDSIAEYKKFVRGYFYGHDNVDKEIEPIPPNQPNKPWWKFW